MKDKYRYPDDSQCLNCGCWFPIVNYINHCPQCFSRNVQVKKLKAINGVQSPLSVVDLTDKLKVLY